VREKGFFVTIEGIGGSGKTTLVKGLAAWLVGQGLTVTTTKEPGGTALGKHLRAVLLEEAAELPAWAEAFLFEADRSLTYSEVIRPALERGEVVISDRNLYGTIAYQGFGGALDIDLIDRMNDAAVQGVYPGLVLVLDLLPEVAIDRVLRSGSGDRFDRRAATFQARVREGYLFAARRDASRAHILDASLPIDDVRRSAARLIATALRSQFPEVALP
jgi:dTMP kinase